MSGDEKEIKQLTSWHWVKQTIDKPLFSDLLWSRPEHKRAAGKLLIVGGNLHGFAAPAEAYQTAATAGIGSAKVLLPDALKKTVGSTIEEAEYAPSTPSGSFSQKALTPLLDLSQWGDGVLIAGDLGRNSETAVLLEQFLKRSSARITLTKDSVDYFVRTPLSLLAREQTTIVCSIAQLQKLGQAAKFAQPITFGMDLVQLVNALHDISLVRPASFIVKHLQNMVVASAGQISTTKLAEDIDIWRVKAAAHAAVWQLQNPTKPFEALTTAVFSLLSEVS